LTAQIRFDKSGRQLPDTGRGCGCRLCEDSGAARYERRQDVARSGGAWSSVRRELFHVIGRLVSSRRSEIA